MSPPYALLNKPPLPTKVPLVSSVRVHVVLLLLRMSVTDLSLDRKTCIRVHAPLSLSLSLRLRLLHLLHLLLSLSRLHLRRV